MKKEILNEINRYRELMSLKEINLINEGAVGDYLSKIGLATIKDDIEAFMKNEAKKLAEEEMKKGTVTSFRAGQQGAKNISNETVESILKQIESKGGKTLTKSQRLAANQQIRKAMAEEVKNSINQSVKEFAEQIGKKNTPSATWQAIKKHFGNNWGKYLAAGTVAAIFAYYWPNVKTPEPQPEPQKCTPPLVFNPTTGKCEQAKKGGDTTPCPVGDTESVKKFHDWLDNNVPNWHDKYGKLEGNVQKGYGVCGHRTRKYWAQLKDEYLSGGQSPKPSQPEPELPTPEDGEDIDTLN